MLLDPVFYLYKTECRLTLSVVLSCNFISFFPWIDCLFLLLQPGYYLKQVGPHSFSCQKLSQISVRLHHKDDAKEPIPSVLLSLSGDNGYRNNSVSGASGSFLFDNLFPGMFYLRPVLKVSILERNFNIL